MATARFRQGQDDSAEIEAEAMGREVSLGILAKGKRGKMIGYLACRMSPSEALLLAQQIRVAAKAAQESDDD